MKIVLFGATGMIGSRILAEALRRGHAVTAVARDPSKVRAEQVKAVKGDVTNPGEVGALVQGQDVVISAYSPPQGREGTMAEVARNLVEAVGKVKPSPRLIVVGGAAGLEVAPGVRVIDDPGFPAAYKAVALAHIAAYEVYKKSGVEWTFFSPAAAIGPGERTGKFRIERDRLVVDENGNSGISAEDYAVAMLDEIEKPRFKRSRMTAGY